MAEALHIDRDRLILSPPDRAVPKRFWTMVKRRERRRADRLHHRSPRFLEHRPPRRSRRAGPAPRFRSADRLGDRAFRRHALARAASSISAPDPARCCSLRSTCGRTPRGSASTCRAGRLSYASANARRLGFEGRLKFRSGNWADGVDEQFDLILCNPPYVAEGAELGPGVREYEPDEALFAGKSGLDAYAQLAPQLPRLLAPGGLAAVEIGHDQAEAVTAAARARRAPGAGRQRLRRPAPRAAVDVDLTCV